MKFNLLFFFLVIFLHFDAYSVAIDMSENVQMRQVKADDIVGKWQNSSRDSSFEIFKQGDKYFGKIIGGTGKSEFDSNNANEHLRSRKLVGLILLTNLVFDGKSTWDDGQIYDPNNGETYSCEVTLESINTLNVRGYLGFSLFGRTEVWTRI